MIFIEKTEQLVSFCNILKQAKDRERRQDDGTEKAQRGREYYPHDHSRACHCCCVAGVRGLA